MKHKIRRPYLFMAVSALLVVAALGFLKYSSLFRLEKISIEPDNQVLKLAALDFPIGQKLFMLPVKSLMGHLLNQENVYRVDLDYQLPNSITIRVNDIRPIALVLGDDGSTLYRLGEDGHLLPLDAPVEQFDFPIITGLKNCVVYKKPGDERLNLLIKQLCRLKKDCIDFYLAISSIDVSDSGSISLYLDGLSFRIDTYAGALYKTIKNLKTFLLDFNPDLHGIEKIDMRSDGLIIAVS